MQDRSELHCLRCSVSPDQICLLHSGTSPAWLQHCSGNSDPTRRRCLSIGTPSTGRLPPPLSRRHERCSFTATLTPSRTEMMAAVRCAARRLGDSLLQRAQVEERRRLVPRRLMHSHHLSTEEAKETQQKKEALYLQNRVL
ncbi:hypothetical protein VPH35_022011 [Triticum aestivum]